MFKRWLKASEKSPPGQDVYHGLRNQILSLKPIDIRIEPPSELTSVWGVLTEFHRPQAIVTLVCLADKTSSLYFSNGGGIIGAGGNELVAIANSRLIETAQPYLARMKVTTEFPFPGRDKVRFYLLTSSATFTTETDQLALEQFRDELTPLFFAAHEVITAIRLSQQSQ